MVETVECVVIGAGVIGLAVARALALAGRDVLILERADAFGTETSSRNSEVLHAGIYYPKGSLMARACVGGRERLVEFCAEHGVALNRCGKLIVATDAAEAERLAAIRDRAAANGVDDLRLIDGAAARGLEPALAATAALLSPSTGIFDSHGYMLALLGDAEAAGASLALGAGAGAIEAGEDGFTVAAGEGADALVLRCRVLVNAAGLGATAVARRIAGLDPARVPDTWLAKGSYFSLAGRAPFTRLIYPVPVPGGLGVHLTLDLGGQARFGPDVEWVDRIDYDVDPRRSDGFEAAIRRYWPGLPDGALVPGYSGIRPKIVPPGAPGQDFVVQDRATHGIPGLVNLFGIESPGLTASLALADLARDAALA